MCLAGANELFECQEETIVQVMEGSVASFSEMCALGINEMSWLVGSNIAEK